MSFVIRLPGTGALSVKHIVRADIHHFAVQFFTDLGNVSRSVRIDSSAKRFIVLRGIHCRIGCTVHHDIGSCLADNLFHTYLIGNVHLVNVHTDGFYIPFGQLRHHIIAKLSLYTCYQYFHHCSPIHMA